MEWPNNPTRGACCSRGVKGESLRVDRHRRIAGHTVAVFIKLEPCPQKIKVTKTKTALEQETYNLSDLKHVLHCDFVELGDSHVDQQPESRLCSSSKDVHWQVSCELRAVLA